MASSAVRGFTTYCAKINIHKALLKQSLPSITPGVRYVHSSQSLRERERFKVTVVFPNGEKQIITARAKESLFDSMKNNHIEIDGFGVCGGGASCSTCHVTFTPEDFRKVYQVSPHDDVEMDTLDLLPTVTNTSRLACQIYMLPKLAGVEAIVPETRCDIREQGPPEDYKAPILTTDLSV